MAVRNLGFSIGMGDYRELRKGGDECLAPRPRQLPIVTYSLVLMNLVLFVGLMQGSPTDLAHWYGLIPAQLQFSAFFTALFLHFEPAHLLANIGFLLLFGRRVERAIGPAEFLLCYIISGIIASLLHVAIAYAFLPRLKPIPLVGASGAVAGVLGMYAVRFRRDSVPLGRIRIPAAGFLLAWFGLQAALGIIALGRQNETAQLTYVAYFAHVGGFVFGMAAAWFGWGERGGVLERLWRRQNADPQRKTLLDVARQYQALSSERPSDPFAYAELGRVRGLLKDQLSSVANYVKAIELYRKEGRREEALACLREAVGFWPETSVDPGTALDPATLFRFACYFESLGEYEEAARRFSTLADVPRAGSEADMALLKLGQVELDKLHHPDRAVQALDRLLKDFPGSRWIDIAEQLRKRASSGGRPEPAADS